MRDDKAELRKQQAEEGKKAWAEYQAEMEAVAAKIERLRAARLAREASMTQEKAKHR